MSKATGTPKVYASVTSGNLLRQVQITDGIAGIVGTATQPENIGVVKTVFSLNDALLKGYSEEKEPFMYRQIQEFYQELGGDQELWLLGTEDKMTLETAVTSTNDNGVKKLLTLSQGRVNLVGVCRNPSATYSSPDGFLDKDVENAVLTSKSLAQYQQSINRPVRFLIEGRVNDVANTTPFQPNTSENSFVGVVLGGTKNDGSASVGLALGRACKYPGHVKLGNGQNGALNITQAFIGSKALEEFTPSELDRLTNAGYIIMHIRDGVAGYYYSVDAMAGNDDFHILVHGRLIDKAQRLATAANTQFLETSMKMTSEGKIDDSDASHLEEVVKSVIRARMEDQISNVDVVVPTGQDLTNTSTLKMQVKIQPLGYLTWIIVDLGLTKNI